MDFQRLLSSRGLMVVPFALFLGVYLQDQSVSHSGEERALSLRVAQRMGEWRPPTLAPEERASLLMERKEILSEVAQIRSRLGRA
jgi:hypothetical protein